jgi:hypothetical protein
MRVGYAVEHEYERRVNRGFAGERVECCHKLLLAFNAIAYVAERRRALMITLGKPVELAAVRVFDCQTRLERERAELIDPFVGASSEKH